MSKKIEEIDLTIDQLLENAKMLSSIQNDPHFGLEKRALEDIQESLFHHLLTLPVSEEEKEAVERVVSEKESTFLSRSSRLRKSRMKQALARR